MHHQWVVMMTNGHAEELTGTFQLLRPGWCLGLEANTARERRSTTGFRRF